VPTPQDFDTSLSRAASSTLIQFVAQFGRLVEIPEIVDLRVRLVESCGDCSRQFLKALKALKAEVLAVELQQVERVQHRLAARRAGVAHRRSRHDPGRTPRPPRDVTGISVAMPSEERPRLHRRCPRRHHCDVQSNVTARAPSRRRRIAGAAQSMKTRRRPTACLRVHFCTDAIASAGANLIRDTGQRGDCP
jgi:hypothetical protein